RRVHAQRRARHSAHLRESKQHLCVVGFFEEDVSQPSTTPATTGTGRVVMSIVASKDGTIIYDPSNPSQIDATRLIQVGKLTKVDNVHLATFTDGSGTGSAFDTRPPVTFNGTQYRIGDT